MFTFSFGSAFAVTGQTYNYTQASDLVTKTVDDLLLAAQNSMNNAVTSYTDATVSVGSTPVTINKTAAKALFQDMYDEYYNALTAAAKAQQQALADAWNLDNNATFVDGSSVLDTDALRNVAKPTYTVASAGVRAAIEAQFEAVQTSQKEDLEKASQQILAAIDEMDKTMISQFTEMFNKINAELDGVFKAMFGGGRASLSMVDPEDVLNTGIDIDVQPPGKMVKNIQTFSGGEKALIAISVLFAILKARTMPLCIFDEVEAALDQANVERFARYLSHYRGQSQFIAVTHRPGTMEQCDTLYGVTMQKDGVSKVLKVQLKDAVHIAKEEK